MGLMHTIKSTEPGYSSRYASWTTPFRCRTSWLADYARPPRKGAGAYGTLRVRVLSFAALQCLGEAMPGGLAGRACLMAPCKQSAVQQACLQPISTGCASN